MNNPEVTNQNYKENIKTLRVQIEKCDSLIKRQQEKRAKLELQIIELNRQYNAPTIAAISNTITSVVDLIPPDVTREVAESIIETILKHTEGKNKVNNSCNTKPKISKKLKLEHAEIETMLPPDEEKKEQISELSSPTAIQYSSISNDLQNVKPY